MARYIIIDYMNLNEKLTSTFAQGTFENSQWKLTLKASGKAYNDGFVILELRYLTGKTNETGFENYNEKIYIQFGSYRGKIIEIQGLQNYKTNLITVLEKGTKLNKLPSQNPFGCRVVVCLRPLENYDPNRNLQALCESTLVSSINPENALKMIEIAIIYKRTKLEEQCMMMLLMHYNELKMTTDWMNLRPSTKAKIEETYLKTILAKDTDKLTTKKSAVRHLMLHCKLR